MKVRRVSDGVMGAGLVFEEDELKLICGYALQSERIVKVKQSFHDEPKGE